MSKKYFIDKNRILKSTDREQEFFEGIEYPLNTFVKVYPEYFIEIRDIDETVTILVDGGDSTYDPTAIEMDTNKLYKQKEQ